MSRRAAGQIRKRRMPGMEGGLNLTPLLDIIFNLIFFFILATNIEDQNRYLEVMLPESTQGVIEPSDSITPRITLTSDDVLALDGVEMKTDELRRELIRLVSQGNATRVIFSGDQRISYQQMIEVAEICTAAGVKEFLPQMEDRE